jgi:hypothetical protein
MLLKENAPCYDPETGKTVPAKELYEYVLCRVHINPDTKTAYKLAFTTNDTACDIGEGATVALVRRWKGEGWSDEDIRRVTGKSPTWCRDTMQLVSLDEKTFAALADGGINRTVAIKLAQVPDVTQRHVQLAEARKFAAERLASLQQKVTKSLEDAEMEAELAEAGLADAETTGNQTKKKIASQRLKQAQETATRKRSEVKQLDQKKIVVTGKDLDRAGATRGQTKALSYNKVMKHWKPALEGMVASGNFGADEAALVLHVLTDGIEKGNRDVEALIRGFLDGRGK